MIINFKINQQKLETSDKIFLADKSNNIIQCKFHISGEDWKNKQKFALLRDNNCNTYQLHLSEENTIKIPFDILEEEKFSISLYGEDNEETRITTNMVNFRLANSGYTEDIKDLEDIDENIWVQIFDGIDSKSDVDHKHNVNDVIDFPSKMPPVDHTHTKSEIVDLVLSTVAVTGEYNDLNNLPVIPVNVSDLVNDEGFVTQIELNDYVTNNYYQEKYNQLVEWIESIFITKSDTNGLVRNDGTIDTTPYLSEHQDITMKADKTYVDNKINDIKDYVDETICNIEEDMLL